MTVPFYAIPRASLVERWHENTPEGFVFSAKFPKVITHDKRLQDCEKETSSFLEAMQPLGDKLRPLVLQFDYTFRFDQFDVLERFLDQLPTENRYAVEIRHRNWLKEEFFDLLSRKQVALVLADSAYMPKLRNLTTDFVYIRWLGNRKDVPDDHYEKIILDRVKELQDWADVVKGFIDKKVQVFGYFNNHYMGHSPGSIRIFMDRIREAL